MSRYGLGFVSGGGTPGNDAFTKILLHMDGSNGGTTFTDVNAGGSAHTWTPSSATTSTTAAKFGPTSMLGATGYISTPAHADFNIGTQDASVDFWINNNGLAGSGYGLCGQADSVGNVGSRSFQISRGSGAGVISVSLVNVGVTATGSLIGTTGLSGTSNWNHVALTKSGTSFRLFLNGVQEASTTFASVNSSTQPFTIGRTGDGGAGSSIFTDEFRFSLGTPRWTANFTPPVSAYT